MQAGKAVSALQPQPEDVRSTDGSCDSSGLWSEEGNTGE